MLSTRHGIRVLGAADLADFLALTAVDPVVNVFAEHRARVTTLEPRWLGGEVWGRYEGSELTSACHVGANLVPVQCDAEAAVLFAERARRRGRTVSTMVGPQDAVAAMWSVLEQSWRPPRDFRWQQPHLQITGPPAVTADPAVRRTVESDLPQLYPACVAMYTEEVGISPEAGGGADLYRARVRQLIARGWSFARFDDGELVFKAEVASATPSAAQIQGVWVHPDRRGEGLAGRGMAAVVDQVQRDIAPAVSLYVNAWNEPARRAYRRAGFVESRRFATIMW